MLALVPEAEIVAVTDPHAGRRDELAAQAGARAVDGVPELLELGVDAVYVCVPPFAHGRVEEQVAAAGAALFVEKPLGIGVEVAERVAAAVRTAGVASAVGHHWRYSDAVVRAREVLGERPVRLVVGSWLDKVPPVDWWGRRDGSGGQIVEQAVHVLDLARVLVGEVEQVHAIADPTPPNVAGADIDGTTVALLRFRRGAVGTVAATCQLGWKHRAGLEIYADALAVTVTEDRLEVHDGTVSTIERFDPDVARLAADQGFVATVLGRAGPCDGALVDYPEALRTHRLACAVAAAAGADR